MDAKPHTHPLPVNSIDVVIHFQMSIAGLAHNFITLALDMVSQKSCRPFVDSPRAF